MPMEVYADESGIHAGSKRFVLAGFAGGRNSLQAFEGQWASILKQFQIPDDVGFHAKTFFARSASGRRFGVYDGWSDKQAERFLYGLVDCVLSHKMYPVGASINLPFFNSLSYNLRRWLTGGVYDDGRRKWVKTGAPTKPYYWAFYQVVIGGVSEAKPGVEVDFIFDRQDDFKKYALNLWNTMKDELQWHTGDHLGNISFASRLERISLQAADLIAFCTYRGEEYNIKTKRLDIAYVIHKLVASRSNMKRFDRQAVDLMLPAYPQSLKEQDEKQSVVRRVRQDDGTTIEGFAQRDQGEIGSRESSKETEA